MIPDGDAFAWYCIDSLVRALHSVSGNPEHQLSLTLALVATVSAVNLPVLPVVLETILKEIEGQESQSAEGDAGEQKVGRQEAVNALFEEISERVGDEGKEFAMRWWDENKARLQRAIGGVGSVEGDVLTSVERGNGKGKEPEVISRL